MKFMALAAALCLGAPAFAQQYYSFNCTGYVGRDSVTVSGAFSVREREDGRTVYKREGNLEINGTDGGTQLWSGRKVAGTNRFFEQVSYKGDGQYFYVNAKADNGSWLKIKIPNRAGSKVRAEHMEMLLVETDTKPEYWHEFEKATCERY